MIKIIKEPTIVLIAKTEPIYENLPKLKEFMLKYDPETTPRNSIEEDNFFSDISDSVLANGPELIAEIMGRVCYRSFGAKRSPKSNKEYIAHATKPVDQHTPGHNSILYHTHFSFFVGGVSMRLARELMRHYIGHAKEEEGSPSQESSRFTIHSGYYVLHPNEQSEWAFEHRMNQMHSIYDQVVDSRFRQHQESEGPDGKAPTGLARKKILEACSMYLPMAAATSFGWTGNPISLSKMFNERSTMFADGEFQRLVKVWSDVCLKDSPSLFEPLLRGTPTTEKRA